MDESSRLLSQRQSFQPATTPRPVTRGTVAFLGTSLDRLFVLFVRIPAFPFDTADFELEGVRITPFTFLIISRLS